MLSAATFSKAENEDGYHASEDDAASDANTHSGAFAERAAAIGTTILRRTTLWFIDIHEAVVCQGVNGESGLMNGEVVSFIVHNQVCLLQKGTADRILRAIGGFAKGKVVGRRCRRVCIEARKWIRKL